MKWQKLIQYWNDWQLSSLVLLNLFLQQLLLFTASLRRRSRPSKWSKGYFWCLYNVSPGIAIYALGILSRASVGNAGADIQAFWAAVLLFHLGGVDDFTALSLEDNKLWIRKCYTLSIQAAVTVYVFFHYFKEPKFRCLMGPFWLIFLSGLFKCVEQVFALRQSTMEALIGSILGVPDPGPDYADTMDRVDGILRSGVLPSIKIDNERADGRPPTHSVSDSPAVTMAADDEAGAEQQQLQEEQEAANTIRSAYFLFSRFKVLFADGIFSFKDRQDARAKFLNKGKDWAFKVVEMELSFVYDRLYTKASLSRHTPWGLLLRVTSLLLTLAGSTWAFSVVRRDTDYPVKHRCVTYTLLLGAVCTDLVTLAFHGISAWSVAQSGWLECCSGMLRNRRRWSGYIAQSNLITFCLQDLPSKSQLTEYFHKGIRPLNRGAASNLEVIGSSLVLPLHVIVRRHLAHQEHRPALLNVKRLLLQKLRARCFWSKYRHTKHVPLSEELQAFIFDEIKEKEKGFNSWEGKIRHHGATLNGHNQNPFTAYRGDRVVKSEMVAEALEWSLQKKEFDESLLIWHIATDLCFRQEDNQGNSSSAQADHDQASDDTCRKYMDMARELSNYLFYIMVVHPLMLSPPTTMAIKRCRDTCAEVRRHFLKEQTQRMKRPANSDTSSEANMSEKNAHESLLKVETPMQASVMKGDKSKSVLWDGCFLAKELARTMPDRQRRWRVVCRVWVEMLCYAAVHCGGYQHAERLKEGGELITFVCLLMTHLGMGKHYRTEVGDAYAYLSAYTAA